MSNYLPSQEIKLYMEVADGRVFTGRCIAASLDITNPMLEVTGYFSNSKTYSNLSPIEWEMNLRGLGIPEWKPGYDIAPGIVSRFLPQSWQCEYCGRANPTKEYQCGSCGWYRGLIADVCQEAGIWRVKR